MLQQLGGQNTFIDLYCCTFQLIKVNQPDLVLFVGEALVGHDAIDQLTKFNQSIADHSNMEKPRLIDGIVLTKFDTIDDKVYSQHYFICSFFVIMSGLIFIKTILLVLVSSPTNVG